MCPVSTYRAAVKLRRRRLLHLPHGPRSGRPLDRMRSVTSPTDACIAPRAGDVDCPDGTGNGPTYAPTTDFRVVGPDVFGLDRDNDGIACETSEADGRGDAVTAAATRQPVGAAPAVASQRALARTGQTSDRQALLAVALVLFGTALLIAPGIFFVPRKRMD